MFYGRKSELAKMNQLYGSDSFECLVIYGRRRVGKTALINEFCRDKPTIFFSAINSTARENLAALSQMVCRYEHPDDPEVYPSVYPDFSTAFNAVTSLAKVRDDRLVFVIDEYPYLARADKSISSLLQHIIDHKWQESRIFLILCGSSMTFMQHQVLGYESPLYGRRTAQIKLEALHYDEIRAFSPDLSLEDCALLYGITGGVPHYINQLRLKDDLDEALIENFFNPASYLFEEPENLLKQELHEPAAYNAIISAIAGGASTPNDIAIRCGLSVTALPNYIGRLQEIDIIRRETPATEKPGRKSIYTINDPFFRFWYRFVPRNFSVIQSEMIRFIYDAAIKTNLSDYMGPIFEGMCRDYLLRHPEIVPFQFCEIGRWWGGSKKTQSQIEIDLVSTPVEGSSYLIGSCKYRNKQTGMRELLKLKSYASSFGKGERYQYFIFSKGGFTDELAGTGKSGDVTLLTLEDMY